MCLEVGAKLATQRTSAACSRQVYRIFASDGDLLMKNIGPCFRFSSSLNKATVTKTYETPR